MFMRKLCAQSWRTFAGVALCAIVGGYANAAKLTFDSTDVSLQKELIAHTTNAYNGTLTASAVFPGDFYFKATSRKSTPVVEQPIPTGTAFNECMAHGYGDGREDERSANLATLQYYSVNCSSSPYFNVPSTAPWNASVCEDTLKKPWHDIYQVFFSTPIPYKGPQP